MISNDELTIAELFDIAFDLQQQLETNKIEQKLETFNIAIDRLKLAEQKLDELHLFSDNEEINEVSTNELRYFILYALIGWLYEYRSSNREQRLNDIHLAISYFIKYLQLCKNYGLIQHIPKEKDDDNEKFRLHTSEDRQTKIQKLKEKKLLEQSIKKLREMTYNHVDDEIKRQLYIEQIKWWIKQTEDDIIELKDEIKLIQFSKDPFPSNNNNTVTPTSTNKLPIDGPFTLVTTKDRLYKEAVGGAAYPSLPTMTIQEFYDDLTKRQSQQPVPPPKPVPLSEEHLNEIDDPIHRQNIHLMDEYKDDNPRGSGNRYNRS
ncbi:unnamed protein product [Rotaria sordida]|uniref:Immunoglobulin-binding protein 1 n=1 Tax=Rotaria sordida TaxID=392033 RepID=A0A815FIC1_9BILA|nr:unnamed protein product [Rotaria sordida]CAF3796380.1 unnamed protein product [Rotaria sordida]